MIKISITNEITNKQYAASFETLEEANTWLESCKNKNSHGLLERTVRLSVGETLDQILVDRATESGEYVVQPRIASQEPVFDSNGDPVLDEDGNQVYEENFISEELRANYYVLPADYVVTLEDLTNDADYLLEKCLKERQDCYKKIDHLLNEALVEKELGDSTKFDAYIQLRQEIKNNIPKP